MRFSGHHNPGCAARPWALLYNAFGVKTGIHQYGYRGLNGNDAYFAGRTFQICFTPSPVKRAIFEFRNSIYLSSLCDTDNRSVRAQQAVIAFCERLSVLPDFGPGTRKLTHPARHSLSLCHDPCLLSLDPRPSSLDLQTGRRPRITIVSATKSYRPWATIGTSRLSKCQNSQPR